ncbi:MAG: methionyl-tRNA formyltransferase [Fidelibacterota bacterium]|nr:MAG: methionyl-tRNA formyltransferase [Candidatus Neomarinimicrobiota bacterium]
MRLVFMGTPEFANPSLQKLHQSSHQVVAVVTGQDKPFGRGRKEEPPPVKRLADKLSYPVLQPASLKDSRFQSHLTDMAVDLFVVVAFRILPDALLLIPPRGAVNLHPSLLPRYRGAAPIQHCLLAGDKITGVTTIALTPQVDAGDILLQREHPIHPEDDFGSLSEKLADFGADMLVETLDGLEQGEIFPRPQAELATGESPIAPKIKPADLVIRWDRPAKAIADQTRAFSPKPGAATFLDGRRLKLFAATAISGEGEPGVMLGVSQGRLQVGTGDGVLAVSEVQIEGRRRMTIDEFLRGTRIEPGSILGQ